MATIGTSYEDYKKSHPLTAHLEANEDGYRPTYWATHAIAEAIGTENDFFDPQKLSALSEEALQEMATDIGVIAQHFDNIAYYSIYGNSSTSDGIEDLYLNGAGDLSAAREFLDLVPQEHDSLVVGILKREFVDGGQPAVSVRESINNSIVEFRDAYEQGLSAAWELKAEMNDLVVHLVEDLSEANIALHSDTLSNLSTEQKDYFKKQFNAWADEQGVDASGVADALEKAFAGELSLDDVLNHDEHGDVALPLDGHDHHHGAGANIELLAHHIIEHNAEAHAADGNNLKNHRADILGLTAEEQAELRAEIESQGLQQVENGFLAQEVLDDLLRDYDIIAAEGHAEADHDAKITAPAPEVLPGVEL